MRIAAHYSHLNGYEWMQVNQPFLWNEVLEIVRAVDAECCRTKESKEKTMRGKMLYAPTEINKAFKQAFGERGWAERRNTFYVTDDEHLARRIHNLAPEAQKRAIKQAGRTPILSYNQTDFVKDRVAVEVQLGKYAFVAHDLFVKHLSFFVSDLIDVGIEILPMKDMERNMSSGVPYYERDLLNVIRQGRGVPAVPLVLIGVTP